MVWWYVNGLLGELARRLRRGWLTLVKRHAIARNTREDELKQSNGSNMFDEESQIRVTSPASKGKPSVAKHGICGEDGYEERRYEDAAKGMDGHPAAGTLVK